MKPVLLSLFVVTLVFQGAASFAADAPKENLSVSAPEEDTSVEAERASFEMAPGYEISLFADETDGIANPIAMRFGPEGRLWVLCSLVYPQVVPTETADDKLFILEDTDGDGRADKTTVFAEGLDMPTGFALGDGGAYVGLGQDLVFLADSDGDGRADTRALIATGFGTGDTHQNINSFSWSPDGELFFCQGLHAFSRIETPWGIVRLDEHGVWRLRLRRRQFHAFRGGSGQNPWGIAFGQWGEPFVKGNSAAISELLPVMVATGHFHRPLDIGKTQIKSMIVEIVDSPHLPDDLQGNALIAGYFARNIDRLTLAPDGAGHRMENLPSLLRTDHRSFRPVDLRTGPDGALYIADWFNPIIGHYQASLRHPDRDQAHGRVWRVTAKGRPLLETVDLTRLPIVGLLDRLKTAPLRERERAREELSNRNSAEVVSAVSTWVGRLDKGDAGYEHHLFEALGVLAWHETVDEPLLRQLHRADSSRARAFATRLVGRWHDRLTGPMAMLEDSIVDEDPRVRLEAVVASSYLPDPGAMPLATKALDRPVDRFIEAALVQAAHATQPRWWPAFAGGELNFEKPEHLAFVLRQTGGADAVQVVRGLLTNPSLDAGSADGLVALLVKIGTPQDMRWALDRAGERVSVLDALAEDYQVRGRLPAGDLVAPLGKMIEEGEPEVQMRAVRLAGIWKVGSLGDRLREKMADDALPVAVRGEAVLAYGKIKGNATIEEIAAIAKENAAPPIRGAALQALCDLDLDRAAALVDGLLRKATTDAEARDLVTPFLGHKGGPAALAKALEAQPLSPALANRVRGVLGSAGRFDAALDRVLRPAAEKGAVGLPEYSEGYVKALSAEVKKEGDATKGAEIYQKAALSCVACHKVGEAGGVLGPELTAVGAGVPVDLLIEAVLWPRRQVKEGYMATNLITKEGETVGGYVDTEDGQRIIISDAATGARRVVPVKQVAERQDAGTLMPPGLTAGLSRADLRDLIRYLSELKGAKPLP